MLKKLLIVPFLIVLIPAVILYFIPSRFSVHNGISSKRDPFKQVFGLVAIGLYALIIYFMFRSNVNIIGDTVTTTFVWNEIAILKIIGSAVLLVITLLTVQYCIDETWTKSKILKRTIGDISQLN